MVNRLPTPGSDSGQWGQILNDFLAVEHNSDGTLKKASDITAAQAAADAKYTKPGSGIPATDLASAIQTSLGKADSALQSADIAGKANDTSVVHLSGAETITGGKNFTGALTKNGQAVVDTTDFRMQDTRTPIDGSVTLAKLAADVTALMDRSRLDYLATGGEATASRRDVTSNSSPITSTQLRLSYFTAYKTETITQLKTYSGTTAAAATPTLCRLGVYREESNGDLTLIASTANDTTLFAAASTLYTKTFTAPFTKTAGVRYAVGTLIVSATTMPTLYASGTLGMLPGQSGGGYRICGAGSQAYTDLPSTVATANINNTSVAPYTELLP